MACGEDMTIRPDSDLVFETGVRRPNRLTLALRTALAMESTIHYQNSLLLQLQAFRKAPKVGLLRISERAGRVGRKLTKIDLGPAEN